MSDRIEPVTIKNARILFRNFAGQKKKFNDEGRRNFCVLLDMNTAREMEEIGWGVKYLKPREEGDEPQPYIQVKVNYNSNYPPKITIDNGGKQTKVKEDTVDILDWAEIDYVHLTLNPNRWENGNRSGISAYLKTMFVYLIPDELEAEFADCGHVCDGDCSKCHAHDEE